MLYEVGMPLVVGARPYHIPELKPVRFSPEGAGNNGERFPVSELELIGVDRIEGSLGDDCIIYELKFRTGNGRIILANSVDGTYFEAEYHLGEGKRPWQVLREREDIYPAVFASVYLEAGERVVTLKHMERALGLASKGDALIVNVNTLDSGRWEGYVSSWFYGKNGIINDPEYNRKSPYFSGEFIEAAIERGIKCLAGNVPSFSRPDADAESDDSTSCETLRKFMVGDRTICAPLLLDDVAGTLGRTAGRCRFVVRPMKAAAGREELLEESSGLLCDPSIEF